MLSPLTGIFNIRQLVKLIYHIGEAQSAKKEWNYKKLPEHHMGSKI